LLLFFVCSQDIDGFISGVILGLPDNEHEHTMAFENIMHYSPSDIASQPK